MHQRMTELVKQMLLQLAATVHEDEKVQMDLWRAFVAAALNLVPWDKPYGQALFNAVSDKSVGVPFEGVMLRWNRPAWWQYRRLEVFMVRRGPNEAYPNKLHVPGTFIRRGEVVGTNDFGPAFQRLSAKEFGSGLLSWELVDIRGGDEERGTSISFLFLVTGSDPAMEGRGAWYPVDNLPLDTVESHQTDIIRRPADEFQFRSRWWVRIGNFFLKWVGAKLARKGEFK